MLFSLSFQLASPDIEFLDLNSEPEEDTPITPAQRIVILPAVNEFSQRGSSADPMIIDDDEEEDEPLISSRFPTQAPPPVESPSLPFHSQVNSNSSFFFLVLRKFQMYSCSFCLF